MNGYEETDFVVEPESATALAPAMNTLLTDDALATRVGLAARTRYEKLFSGAALGRTYAKLFPRLCQVKVKGRFIRCPTGLHMQFLSHR